MAGRVRAAIRRAAPDRPGLSLRKQLILSKYVRGEISLKEACHRVVRLRPPVKEPAA